MGSPLCRWSTTACAPNTLQNRYGRGGTYVCRTDEEVVEEECTYMHIGPNDMVMCMYLVQLKFIHALPSLHIQYACTQHTHAPIHPPELPMEEAIAVTVKRLQHIHTLLVRSICHTPTVQPNRHDASPLLQFLRQVRVGTEQ